MLTQTLHFHFLFNTTRMNHKSVLSPWYRKWVVNFLGKLASIYVYAGIKNFIQRIVSGLEESCFTCTAHFTLYAFSITYDDYSGFLRIFINSKPMSAFCNR